MQPNIETLRRYFPQLRKAYQPSVEAPEFCRVTVVELPSAENTRTYTQHFDPCDEIFNLCVGTLIVRPWSKIVGVE